MKYKITLFSNNVSIPESEYIRFISETFSPEAILKNNYRSYVFIVTIDGVKYVFKNPRDKNRRRWIRFLTLFRKSEAVAALQSMQALLSLGILTTKPIASIEKRSFGMAVDSWMVYEYLEANPINTSDISKSYDLLCDLHRAGYLHGNPQEQNFLKTNDGEIVVIDAKLKRFRIFTCNDFIEKINFANSFRETTDRFYANELIAQTPSIRYDIAKFKLTFFRFIKKPKYWLKAMK